MKPTRYTDPPSEGVTPDPGVYTFGMSDRKRKALNFAPGLVSYTKLRRHDEPDQKISPFVAGVGNLVSDTLLFGDDAILGKYVFHGEQVDFRPKAGREWRDRWVEDNPGMVLIRPKERSEAARLIEVARANPEFKRMLGTFGYCEAGLVSDVNGLRFRSWVDKVTQKAVIDLKTTRAASPAEFLEGVVKYGYDAQAALYLDQCESLGLGQLNFLWAIISKTSNRAWLQPMPPWAYHTGRRWIATLCRSFRRETILKKENTDG
jgi:hypothetical protein